MIDGMTRETTSESTDKHLRIITNQTYLKVHAEQYNKEDHAYKWVYKSLTTILGKFNHA